MAKYRPPELGSMLPPDLSKLKEDDAARWQSSVVESMCKRLKISPAKRREMRSWAERQGRLNDLTFEGFHEVIADFPMFFAGHLFRNLGKMVPVSKLFTRFHTTPIYKIYLQVCDDVPETATVLKFGLVFRWPNMMQTGGTPAEGCLVVHNRQPSMDVSGMRMLWILNPKSNPSAKSKEVIRLYLTPLQVLLSEILADKAWEL